MAKSDFRSHRCNKFEILRRSTMSSVRGHCSLSASSGGTHGELVTVLRFIQNLHRTEPARRLTADRKFAA